MPKFVGASEWSKTGTRNANRKETYNYHYYDFILSLQACYSKQTSHDVDYELIILDPNNVFPETVRQKTVE